MVTPQQRGLLITTTQTTVRATHLNKLFIGLLPFVAMRRSVCKITFHCFVGIQTIDSTQALFLPIGASVSLLVMFFFFDSVQVVFTICTAGNYCSEHLIYMRVSTLGTRFFLCG